MNVEEQRTERLIAMAERLIEALEGDIAALKQGNPRGLRTIEPEILKLTALYSREAKALNAKEAPVKSRQRLLDLTARFRDLLGVQTRLLTRMRGASEGMIRAVTEEIERQRAPLKTYGAAPAAARSSASAMLYNSVV